MSVLNLFKRTKSPELKRDDAIEAISGILGLQLNLAEGHAIGTGETINKRALGYIWGFVEAAMAIYKFDLVNSDDFVVILYRVLKNLRPQHVTEYMDFLMQHMEKDEQVISGYNHGLDEGILLFAKVANDAPVVGLTQILLGGEADELTM